MVREVGDRILAPGPSGILRAVFCFFPVPRPHWRRIATTPGAVFSPELSPGNLSTFIQGYFFGGQVSDSNAVVAPKYVAATSQAQPRRDPFQPPKTDADPVDMETGAFQLDHTDLSLGGAEPRGITFGRHYSSNGRLYSSGGMGPGWVNNYSMSAQAVVAEKASFGRATPAQMAPMLAATCAAIGIYNNAQPAPKNWMVTALIAKWALDQANKKGVSVQLGKDTVQFVQQPDGSFTPDRKSVV